MVHNRAEVRSQNELGFGKRPEEELYDLKADPHQINNLASDSKYNQMKKELSDRLMKVLKEQNDPRVCEAECCFERSPYTDLIAGYQTYEQASERWKQSL